MAKNDNPHALRFISSMEKHNLGEEAIKFSQEHPLSKSADIEKKFEWAQHKRIEKGLPQTWCYCTLGYTKKMFEFIFDAEVKVELLSSIKLGNENCRT